MSIEQKKEQAFEMIKKLIQMRHEGHQHSAIQTSIKHSLTYWKQEFASYV